ncbi:MAG: glycosyltransferase family 4 protein [bacterium]|nr:glycosyltransferase family 4 protein [bacterium]
MKKILVITPFFYPHIGGSERYMEELYANVIMSNRDVHVDVLCYNTDNQPRDDRYRGMAIHRVPCWQVLRGQFCIPEPISLLRFLFSQKARSYNLIHCSTRFFDSSWWAPLYAKLTKRPIWLTDHCASFPIHPNALIRTVAKWIDLAAGKVFLPLYDRIYVVSKETRVFLKQYYNLSSELMYAGVDTKFFHPVSRAAGKRVKIVYVGRMIASKGIEDLFAIAKSMPEADFVLAGPGKLGESLKSEVDKHRLEHIRILPALDRQETAKLLQSADIFVHPSRHSEGIPLVLLEAGACGLAVVATDVGGVREVVSHGTSGILVPPNSLQALREALERLINNTNNREAYGEMLHRQIQKRFNWENSIEKLF